MINGRRKTFPGAKLLAKLVVEVSITGDPPWHPVKSEEVPDWLKDPDVMGYLVEGGVAHVPDLNTPYYRARRVP